MAEEKPDLNQAGWCVPDMPKQANGQPIYSKPDPT
jgi:hypothetical protein